MLNQYARPMIVCALLSAAATASAQSSEGAAAITASGLEIAAAITTSLEGPTSDADGNVYFTDHNRILRLETDGRVSTFRQEANRANGLVFDAQFRLIAAENGDPATNTPPRITRTDLKTGRIEVLADGYEGARFTDTNDVTFDAKGRIYFTEYQAGGVYRIDTDGRVTRIVGAPLVDHPNGLIISPDDRTLYIAEQNPIANGSRRIRAFDLGPDGAASNPRVFHNFYPGHGADGMAIDTEGNLYLTAGINRLPTPPTTRNETLDVKAGIHVFSPAGALIQYIPLSLDFPATAVSNVAFGGPDLRTLFATAGNTLFKISTKIAGTRR